MCQIVIMGERELWNVAALLDAGVITEEHVPADPELARMQVDVLKVCFCAVDVERLLTECEVPFTVDEQGDVHIEDKPEAPVPQDAPAHSAFDAWRRLWHPSMA